MCCIIPYSLYPNLFLNCYSLMPFIHIPSLFLVSISLLFIPRSYEGRFRVFPIPPNQPDPLRPKLCQKLSSYERILNNHFFANDLTLPDHTHIPYVLEHTLKNLKYQLRCIAGIYSLNIHEKLNISSRYLLLQIPLYDLKGILIT